MSMISATRVGLLGAHASKAPFHLRILATKLPMLIENCSALITI